MKKLSTLAFMAFFFCLSAMAQVALGDINFSLKEGQKISPTTGKITVTFPNVTGVADPTTTNFVLAGAFNDIDFDGVNIDRDFKEYLTYTMDREETEMRHGEN